MPDKAEREEMIDCTVANYRSGEFGRMRATSLLVLCGLNAKEIFDLLEPFRSEAIENYAAYKRHPVK